MEICAKKMQQKKAENEWLNRFILMDYNGTQIYNEIAEIGDNFF